jgi:hypothetical protein
MTEARRAAVIAELVRRLRAHHSWTGETHVQKTAYFLQEMLGIPLGLRYTLYKFGPFSFELRDQLTDMRGLGQLKLEPQPRPYGPKLAAGDGAEQLRTRFPKTIARNESAIEFVAEQFGSLGVGSLERLATALMVSQEMPDASLDEQAERLNSYKPHVSQDEAKAALEKVAAARAQAVESGLIAA